MCSWLPAKACSCGSAWLAHHVLITCCPSCCVPELLPASPANCAEAARSANKPTAAAAAAAAAPASQQSSDEDEEGEEERAAWSLERQTGGHWD